MSVAKEISCKHKYLLLSSGSFTDCIECGKSLEDIKDELENAVVEIKKDIFTKNEKSKKNE